MDIGQSHDVHVPKLHVHTCTSTTGGFSCSVDKFHVQVEGFLVSKRAPLASPLSALVLP